MANMISLQQTASQIKDLLHLKDPAEMCHAAEFDESPSDDESALVAELQEDPGLNPSQANPSARYEEEHGKGEKTKKLLKTVAETIAHPKEAIHKHSHKKAAAVLATSRPVIPKKNDQEFLEASDRVEGRDMGAGAQQQDSGGLESGEGDDDQADDVKELQDLMGERDSLRVAWTTDLHLRRVAAVERNVRRLPKLVDFEVLDDDGSKMIQWDKFIGTYLLNASWPYTSPYVDDFDSVPSDTDMLRRHVHRLLVVSAPLQKWIVRLRKVYRWEDPWNTAGWAAIYFFVLCIDRVATFFLGMIIYYTIMNGMYPSRPTESTDAIRRKLDDTKSPSTVAELMDQCSQDNWLIPLLDMIGPIMQLQLNDCADLLEIMDNFYHWKHPVATARTLVSLSVLLLALNIFSVHFLLWSSYVVLGLVFFCAWPISSLHPQYRLIVSQIRWLFWGVPTHAAWSIQELQMHAALVRKGLRVREQKGYQTSLANPSEVELVSFRCALGKRPGRFVVTTAAVRFGAAEVAHKCTGSEDVRFCVTYSQIREMSKQQTRLRQAMPTSAATKLLNSLEIVYEAAGEKRSAVFNNFPSRDRAFNLILAFSMMEWKNLQPLK